MGRFAEIMDMWWGFGPGPYNNFSFFFLEHLALKARKWFLIVVNGLFVDFEFECTGKVQNHGFFVSQSRGLFD